MEQNLGRVFSDFHVCTPKLPPRNVGGTVCIQKTCSQGATHPFKRCHPTTKSNYVGGKVCYGGWHRLLLCRRCLTSILCLRPAVPFGAGVNGTQNPVGPFRQLTPEPFTTSIPKLNGDKALASINRQHFNAWPNAIALRGCRLGRHERFRAIRGRH